MLVASYHVFLGHALISHPFSLSQEASSSEQVFAPVGPSPPAPEPSPRHKQWSPSPDPVDVLPQSRTTSTATLEGPTSSEWQEVMPLYKALTGSCLEAFIQDSSLVRKMREEYFRRHYPDFNNENTCDLTDVFCNLSETTGQLGSTIYEIKEAWTGQNELWQANYALRTLLKGLKFFRAVSLSESPKVMGLMDIHDPDGLWLVCEKCFHCLTTMSEAICHHGQKGCQSSGEGGPNESSSSA